MISAVATIANNSVVTPGSLRTEPATPRMVRK